MSSKKVRKAEILMGIRAERSGIPTPCPQNVYALYVDEEMIYSRAYLTPSDHMATCIENAREFAKEMKARDVNKYEISNGHVANGEERLPCNPIPEDGVEIFRRTLDAELKK